MKCIVTQLSVRHMTHKSLLCPATTFHILSIWYSHYLGVELSFFVKELVAGGEDSILLYVSS